MKLLSGRTAVVTGGARGLGHSIAAAYLSHGANVVLGDLDPIEVKDAAAGLGAEGRVVGTRCDVTRADDVDALLRLAEEEFGRLDIMVNNAGITRDATMRKMSERDFDEVIAVHLRGTWLGTRAACDRMRARGTAGAVVNVSSISGKVGNPGQTNYSAAKAGIVGLTKAAAKEVGFAGVRVNAVQPGLIETAMTEAMPDDVRAARLGDVPLGRFGRPEEVADVAVFLASDMASYLTGVTIEIAGGRHL